MLIEILKYDDDTKKDTSLYSILRSIEDVVHQDLLLEKMKCNCEKLVCFSQCFCRRCIKIRSLIETSGVHVNATLKIKMESLVRSKQGMLKGFSPKKGGGWA